MSTDNSTAPDPWTSSTSGPADQDPAADYEQQLAAAGYGEAARRRYIEQGPRGAEINELEWDNSIIPAAEAAGLIPKPPVPAPSLDECARHWAGRQAYWELDEATGYCPLDGDLTPVQREQLRQRTQQLLETHGAALRGFLTDNPTPAWSDYDQVAQKRVAEWERNIFALLATPPEPLMVTLCGSTRYMAEMAEAAIRETVAGHVVLQPACDLKTPHPLWQDPAQADDLKARLGELHRYKVFISDEVLVVGPDYGDSTRAEIAYAREQGIPVRFTHASAQQQDQTERTAK